MEQKVQVLVDNVADSARAVLQSTAVHNTTSEAATRAPDSNIQTSDASRALSKDVGQLRRLVHASIAALRNAEIQDLQRVRETTAGTAGAVEVTPASAPITKWKRGGGSGRKQASPPAMGQTSEADHTDNVREIGATALSPDAATSGTDTVRTGGWSPSFSENVLEGGNSRIISSPAATGNTIT